MKKSMQLEPVIGLEIHLQLKTKSKMFCRCKNEWLEAAPNFNICPICLGHPGVLPVINQEAIKMALMLGLALNGQIAEKSQFDRKNYFYPDLPKGYQISQYNLPLVQKAWLELNGRKVAIKRIHLEEDTAKLLHNKDNQYSLLDFNRAGVPLLEIVTEPDIATPSEAKNFLRELQLLVRHLGLSEADMEKGQMRCDTNISLRPLDDNKFYPKTEIKNLNSAKAVENSLEYEIKRQAKLWQEGEPPKTQSTRGWDEKRGVTIEQRTKEEEMDYRYFPEPDLPILSLSASDSEARRDTKLSVPTSEATSGLPFDLEHLRQTLPELPLAKRERFIAMYGFDSISARILAENKELANFTEKVITELKAWLVSLETVEGEEQEIWQKNKNRLVKLVGNWLVNNLLQLMNENNMAVTDLKISSKHFAEFVIMLYENKISGVIAKQILGQMFLTGVSPEQAIADGQIKSIEDGGEIEEIIGRVIKKNPVAVSDYKNGKTTAIIYLIGQVMKEARGRANPDLVRKILEDKL